MKGAASRLIRQRGREYTVENASGGDGRDVPTYSPDGTIVGVLERRGMPRTMTDSAGEEIQTDTELRAVVDDGVTIQPAGTADGYPSKLIHPNGNEYRAIQSHPEDSGVTVIALIRDS